MPAKAMQHDPQCDTSQQLGSSSSSAIISNSTELLPLVLRNNLPADFARVVPSIIFAFQSHHHLKYDFIDLLHNSQFLRKTARPGF
jgi:hypothetical protein